MSRGLSGWVLRHGRKALLYCKADELSATYIDCPPIIAVQLMSPSTPHSSRSRGRRRKQQRRTAPLGSRFWHCPNCDAVVAIQIKAGHTCLAAISNLVPSNDTPLDRFFLAYPSFKYDRTLPPAESFQRLRRHQRWKRGSPESEEGWDGYQKALKEEFQLWYGAEDDIGAWHALCRAIQIKPLPKTCHECEKVRVTQEIYPCRMTLTHLRLCGIGM